MIDKKYKIAVIIEDNVGKVNENITKLITKYLDKLPSDWDILFDGGNFLNYTEEPIVHNKIVYSKGNTHGGTKAAQFYMINLNFAMRLYQKYIPFEHAPDHHMNYLFNQLNPNTYWAEPCNVFTEENHVSTVQ